MADNADKSLKPLSLAVGAALVAGLGAAAHSSAADASPFAAADLPSGYMAATPGEGKCGGEKGEEGACGSEKGEEGACGGDKGEEGACGGDKGEEGKCGEGKCGAV